MLEEVPVETQEARPQAEPSAPEAPEANELPSEIPKPSQPQIEPSDPPKRKPGEALCPTSKHAYSTHIHTFTYQYLRADTLEYQ